MRSTWTLLDVGWKRLRSEWRQWLALVAFQILMTVVGGIGLVLALLVAATIAVVVLKTMILIKILGLLFAAAIAVAAVCAAVYFIGGAYLALIVAALGTKQLSVTEYYAAGRGAVKRLVTSQLWLLLWVVLLCCIPLALLLVAYGVHSTGLGLVAILLFFALVIGLALLSVRFTILPYIVIGEGLGGRPAVSRSWSLTDGRWWKALLVIGAMELIALLVGVIDDIATVGGGVWSDIASVIYVLISFGLTVWTLLVLREFYRDLSATGKK
jgi:hypothetical protein